ncbi:MAG: hypothetical protein FWE04_01520 [Oscillospiraceae bacterium]|nr:hypothetical protein [Oscillospiraceae bacterium]
MNYECYDCGTEMEKTDDEVLVCPKCNYSVNIEDYADQTEIYEEVYGGQDMDNDNVWREDANFPEEFPGERYEDVYENE